ncbi:hypothetical protein MP228_012374 [Amoeboaphelidium protococcarum]|nr:hypothetical protein MP228_012374 [Amoeboaphelidium protococcarum]
MKVESSKLSNGVSLPSIGLGTYRLKGEDAFRVVYDALKLGYRCIDTAAVYRNEESVGQAIHKWIQDDPESNQYDDLFITTKLAPKDHGELAYEALKSSIQRLGVPYVKCLMIHWPAVKGLKHDDARNREMRAQSYAAIERLYTEGLCRCIGLSNYEIRHIEEVLRTCTIKPHLLQVELHPLYPQTELVQFCKQHQIHVQAYSSFGEGKLVNGDINLKSVREIATAHDITTAQVLLAWALTQHISVIPKSSSSQRLRENLMLDCELSSLTDSKMILINDECKSIRQKFCWDPSKVE